MGRGPAASLLLINTDSEDRTNDDVSGRATKEVYRGLLSLFLFLQFFFCVF